MSGYIEADALKRALVINGFRNDADMMMTLETINNATTIEAEPVRHGKWKRSGKWGRVYRCNQCGNYLDFDGVNVGRGSANFCPNCGARMDEDE